MLIAMSSLNAFALDCHGLVQESCDATNAILAQLEAQAPGVMTEASTNVRLRPSSVYGEVESARAAGADGGCDADGPTILGTEAGTWKRLRWNGLWTQGADQGSNAGKWTRSGAWTGSYSGDASGSYGAVLSAWRGNGRILADRGIDHRAGVWVRTQGRHGIWLGIIGSCPDPFENVYDGWFGGGIGTDVDDDGFTAGQDCDDADGTVFPGALEICDGQRNDCDDVAWSLASEPALTRTVGEVRTNHTSFPTLNQEASYAVCADLTAPSQVFSNSTVTTPLPDVPEMDGDIALLSDALFTVDGVDLAGVITGDGHVALSDMAVRSGANQPLRLLGGAVMTDVQLLSTLAGGSAGASFLEATEATRTTFNNTPIAYSAFQSTDSTFLESLSLRTLGGIVGHSSIHGGSVQCGLAPMDFTGGPVTIDGATIDGCLVRSNGAAVDVRLQNSTIGGPGNVTYRFWTLNHSTMEVVDSTLTGTAFGLGRVDSDSLSFENVSADAGIDSTVIATGVETVDLDLVGGVFDAVCDTTDGCTGPSAP